ncbi:hypothetical protein AAG570_004601 [Ranatra chinensis]|uniref:Protein kinase domain-containing protein n=1 Tax=Ranatra chinensis TaxID=642074 RepID=A0ABD0YPW2_9HEMI
MLLLAIAFIVYRNRRHKSQRDHSVLPSEKTEMQLRDNINANGHMYGQVSLEDPEKNALYHEPLTNINMYAYEPQNQIPLQLQSPEYTEEYAIPLVNPVSPPVATFTANQVPPTPIRTTQPFRNFPPPVPPPPEKHYAATEIISPPPSIPPSVGSQGASSSTTSSYGHISSCNQIETDDVQSADVPHIPREDLRFLKRLGSGSFGEIHHCELSRFPDGFNSYTCKYVAVKILRKNASEQLRDEFFEDISHLASLKNRNIAQLLGTCLSEDPYLIIIEHTDHSDLNQFLQEHIVETATPFPTNANTLSYGCLIYMATQISFGMKYLESMKIVFRDLATRNCIVGRNYSVKISDLGLGRSLYSQDYYDYKDGNESLPIRWMAWESIIFRKFSIKSDVWAFAVTLWEILTFAREQPFDEYSDEKIIENATHYYHDDKLELKLPKPFNCPKEIYDLMVECWQRKESERPNFREIHLFLQRKNLGYKQGAKRVK